MIAATGHSTAHHQLNARVHWLPDGRFLLAYDTVDANIDDFWGISVRAYNAFGFDDGPRRRANRTASGDQRLGFLIPVSTNRVWTGWTGTDSDGAGIRYRVLERF